LVFLCRREVVVVVVSVSAVSGLLCFSSFKGVEGFSAEGGSGSGASDDSV